MNKNSRRLMVYVTLISIFTVLAVCFRTAACMLNLDYTYGYFNEKAFINTASILLFGAILIAFSFAAVGHRVALRPSFSSPATFIPTGIVGGALLFFAIRLLSQLGELRENYKNAILANPDQRGTAQLVLLLTTALCGIAALLSIAHFFFNAFITEAKTELRAYFAIATVIGFSSYAAYLYFIGGTSINSPNRLIDQLTYIFSALFFLYEARISLGREKWRGYCVFGLSASACAAYSALPTLIVYLTKGELLSISIEETVLTLSLFIFITARIILAIWLSEAEKNKKIAAIEDFAEQRRRTAADTDRRYDEAYAIQLSIEDVTTEEKMPHVSDEYEPTDEFVLPSSDELSTVFVSEADDTDMEDGQIELSPDVFIVGTAEGTDTDSDEDGEN